MDGVRESMKLKRKDDEDLKGIKTGRIQLVLNLKIKYSIAFCYYVIYVLFRLGKQHCEIPK